MRSICTRPAAKRVHRNSKLRHRSAARGQDADTGLNRQSPAVLEPSPGTWNPDDDAQRSALLHNLCPTCGSHHTDNLSVYLGPSATGLWECFRCRLEFVSPWVPSDDVLHGVLSIEPSYTVIEPTIDISDRLRRLCRHLRRRSP
jgi:hypothetical protein